MVGPDDDLPRPATLLFHGCGGLRDHLPLYAAQAKAQGWRAFIVDSFGARGWSREFALATVCTGLVLQGWQRGGDVLAAVHGVSQRRDVDETRINLSGWSHGGWSIMEAASADRNAMGSLYLKDAEAADLTGVTSAYLAYPYVGVGAINRSRPWTIAPRTLAVIARKDHLTTVRNAERVCASARGCGVQMETWIADGTHAFDEPTSSAPMRHDPLLAQEAIRRYGGLLGAVSP